MAIWDVSRAYIYVSAVMLVYVKVVDGDYGDGGDQSCGRLNVSTYGAGAALNWHVNCRSHLISMGFQ